MPSVEVFYSRSTSHPKPKSTTTIATAFPAVKYRSTNIVSVLAGMGGARIVGSLIIGISDH